MENTAAITGFRGEGRKEDCCGHHCLTDLWLSNWMAVTFPAERKSPRNGGYLKDVGHALRVSRNALIAFIMELFRLLDNVS
jgi:hypothetical protein